MRTEDERQLDNEQRAIGDFLKDTPNRTQDFGSQDEADVEHRNRRILSRFIYNLIDQEGNLEDFHLRAEDQVAELIDLFENKGYVRKYSDPYSILNGRLMRPNFRADEFEVLAEKLRILYKVCETKQFSVLEEKESYYSEAKKLIDYFALEAARMKFHIQEQKDIERLHNIQQENKQLNEKLVEDTKHFQTQSITVLSIFTGIVMAFFGGFTLLGNIMAPKNIASKHFERVILLAALIGFILFNTIVVFIYCAAKISGRSIGITCKSNSCVDCSEKSCSFVGKLFKKYPYIAWIDIILLVICALFAYLSMK